jgi:hypothetical protein
MLSLRVSGLGIHPLHNIPTLDEVTDGRADAVNLGRRCGDLVVPAR